jgi:hypothetical protein
MNENVTIKLVVWQAISVHHASPSSWHLASSIDGGADAWSFSGGVHHRPLIPASGRLCRVSI